MQPRKTSLHANISPGEYNWIGVSSGMRGLNFNYVIRQDEGTVELYIDRGAEEDEMRTSGSFDRLSATRKKSRPPSAGTCRGNGST